MPTENQKPTEKETVDIAEEASELGSAALGSLEEINKEKEIGHRWFREWAIVLLSIAVILVVAAIAGIQVFSSETDSQNWGRQTLGTLLGFAAGAIFQRRKKE